MKDVQLDDHQLQKVGKEKYLEDILSADGSNIENVISRQKKSFGINKQISSMLREVCYGPYHFEVAMVFRETLLLSSILTNCEAWYKVKDQEIDILEKCDESLIRLVFETPSTTTKCMLYLEAGIKPIRFYIMASRLMFLWYILNEDDSSLIKRFFKAQENDPCKSDWIESVKENLEYLEIFISFDQIKNSTREQFKCLVDDSIDEKAFEKLISEKDSKNKTKVAHIKYQELSMQEYLKDKKISIQQKKFIFLLRSRMLDVAGNYPHKYDSKLCPICKEENSLDNQEHVLQCRKLMKRNQVVATPSVYSDFFGDDVNKMVEVASVIKENFQKRNEILKKRKLSPSNEEEPSEPEVSFSVLQ